MAKGQEPQGKLHEIVGSPFAIGICDRTLCFTDGDSKTLRRFSLDTGEELPATPVFNLHLAVGPTRYAFEHEDGTRVAASDGTVCATVERAKDQDRLRIDAFDADGALASGHKSDYAAVWDGRSGKLLAGLHCKRVYKAVMAPDGARIALLCYKIASAIWRHELGTVVGLKGVNLATPRFGAWSPDGKTLVLATYTQAFVCDAVSARLTHKIRFPTHTSTGVFVPGQPLFLSGSGRSLTVWDTKTWEISGSLPIPATKVAASADRIVTGDSGAPVTIWDAAQLLGTAPKPAAKPAKRAPRKPVTKPVRAVFFGVPAKVSEQQILDAVASLHHILDRQPPNFAVKVLLADGGRDRHWFTCVGTRSRNYLLEPWIECLHEALKVPLDVVLHDGVTCKVEARRFSTPWRSKPVKLEPVYLPAADVPDPVLVIRAGKRAQQRTKPAAIANLVGVVELAWPTG